jgi:hypothetical protein
MVWQNLTDNEAAAKSKITVTAIRLALRRPHVRAYFREQSDVLREREGPRGIHTLIAVRDQDSNQAARVAAVREMRQVNDEEAAKTGRTSLPGLQIVIVQGSTPVIRSVNDERPVTISTTYDGNSTHGP